MKAKQILLKYARNSIAPKYAKKLCDAFNVEFDNRLIYKKLRYREIADEIPRVAITDLSEHIARKLNKQPHNDKLHLASRLFGVGSSAEVTTEAWIFNLPNGKDIKD